MVPTYALLNVCLLMGVLGVTSLNIEISDHVKVEIPTEFSFDNSPSDLVLPGSEGKREPISRGFDAISPGNFTGVMIILEWFPPAWRRPQDRGPGSSNGCFLARSVPITPGVTATATITIPASAVPDDVRGRLKMRPVWPRDAHPLSGGGGWRSDLFTIVGGTGHWERQELKSENFYLMMPPGQLACEGVDCVRRCLDSCGDPPRDRARNEACDDCIRSCPGMSMYMGSRAYKGSGGGGSGSTAPGSAGEPAGTGFVKGPAPPAIGPNTSALTGQTTDLPGVCYYEPVLAL